MTRADAAPRATWRDYFVLTKPKVIVLLLMTTVGAMFIAAGGFPGWVTLLGAIVGGYMSAGAAGVYNMVYDADIDVRMKRTAKRPTVTRVVSTRNALVFAVVLTAVIYVAFLHGLNVPLPEGSLFE
jgi:protoheme IX farnesyltransferase